jgi:hypothetical protein
MAVVQALASGKPVPPEVLKDYPDLLAKQAPVAPPVATAAFGEDKSSQGGQPVSRRPHKAEKAVKKDTGPVSSKDELVKRQAERTPRARAMDLAKQHHIVVKPNNPLTNTWIKRPGRLDVSGIDTRHRIKITLKPDTSKPRNYNPKSPKFRESRRLRGIDLGGGVEQTRKGRHLRLR